MRGKSSAQQLGDVLIQVVKVHIVEVWPSLGTRSVALCGLSITSKWRVRGLFIALALLWMEFIQLNLSSLESKHSISLQSQGRGSHSQAVIHPTKAGVNLFYGY